MKSICSDLWNALVEVAEGKPNPEVDSHLAECSECRKKLGQLKAFLDRARFPMFEAPLSLIEAAASLMPETTKRMSLLRSTLSSVGARSVAQDFQAVYQVEDVQLRVLYEATEHGWETLAQAPSPDWHVERAGKPIEVDAQGRFSFNAQELADTGFELIREEKRLIVPSGLEAVNRGSDQPD